MAIIQDTLNEKTQSHAKNQKSSKAKNVFFPN